LRIAPLWAVAMSDVSDKAFAKRLLLTMAGQGIVLSVVMYFLARIMNDNKEETFRRWVAGKFVRLSRGEHNLLSCVCDPTDIKEDFNSIGGCSHVKDVVQRSVVLPMKHPELYPANSLRSPPKGVLLHGPPGTGKTLVAKAIARTCGASFVEVRVENLFGKWLGQSEQTVAAIFSLARKLQPAIIFVDEIDSLLSRRDFSDNHAYSNAKTIFLRQWDGFSTSESDHRVVVVGATNCPEVLDPAVMRRLPVKLHLDLPAQTERGEDLSSVSLPDLAKQTPLFSGSDLRELCKQALLLMVQDEVTRRERDDGEATGSSSTAAHSPPVLTKHCFDRALCVVKANADFMNVLAGSGGKQKGAQRRSAPAGIGRRDRFDSEGFVSAPDTDGAQSSVSD